MKKILSLVLAIMMVLSMASTAFATTFEDVTDATTAKAVDALSSLGISNGYPDGTFRPEGSITRAEMVKLLVVALGHEDLANGAKSSFSDAQGTWYDGYAAVAQAIGITNGTGAGKFNGNSKITYSEVITMVLRALGYRDRSVNANRQEVYNATAYKTTAARLGVLKNVTVGAAEANRGDVAKMVYNALEVQIVDTNSDGNPVLQWILAPNPTTNTAGQARTLLDDVAIRTEVTIGVADLFGEHPMDLTDYLGEKVVAYTNADGEILFVKYSISAANLMVKKGTINSTSSTANWFKVTTSPTTVASYTMTSGQAIDLIVNNVKTAETPASLITKLDNISNRVHKIKVVSANASAPMTVVVEDVTNMFRVNVTHVEGKTKFHGLNLPTKNGKVDTTKLVFVGAAESLEDIQKDDVVQACVASTNIKFYVTRDTVEGKVTERKSNGTYVVNGEVYWLNGTLNGTQTLTLGDEGIFYLDKDGDIAYNVTKSTVIANYGIIKTDNYNNGTIATSFGKESIAKQPQVKMVTMDGKEKAYDVVITPAYTGNTITNVSATGFNVTRTGASIEIALNVGSEIKTSATTGTGEYLVKYVLNDDGKIIYVESATISGYASTQKTKPGFLAGDKTVVLGRSATGYSLVDVTKLTDATIGYQAVTNNSNFDWDLVVITSGLGTQNTVKTFAVVKSISNVLNAAGTATVQKVTAWVDGVEVTYTTNANNVATTRNEVYTATFNTSGLLTGLTAPTSGNGLLASTVTATAVSSNGRIIEVSNATQYYTLSTDVVIYKAPASASGTASIGDLNDIRIANGTARISMFDKDGDNVVDVIFIH